MRNFDYYLPEAAAGAVDVLATVPHAVLKAGGTDLLGLMKTGIVHPAAIVNLPAAGDLVGIRKSASGKITIGAATTIAEVAAHEDLRRTASAVADAAAETATPLIRTRATVGGNLCQRPRCWYFRHPDYPCRKKGGHHCFAEDGENKYHAVFGDFPCHIVHPSNLAPALWAFDAGVTVRGPQGTRDVPLAEFWVNPDQDIKTETALAAGEIVTGVTFAPSGPGAGSAYLEVREKQSFDWALVSAACRVDLDGQKVRDVRIVVSAVAPVPLRREAAEAVLRGQAFSEDRAWAAGAAAVDGATPLRDNAYKVPMLKACVAHALIKAALRAG